ncbi:MAG: alpha/beta hydrolase-fold protein [Bacteroidota bacterium]
MHYFRFLSQSLGALFRGDHRPIVRNYRLSSRELGRKVKVTIYRPPILPTQNCRLLLCLDGQDLPRMDMQGILRSHYRKYPSRPVVVVGIHAADRIREYGTAGRPDYQGRGDQSTAHQQFIIQRLLPWLEGRYQLWPAAKYRATIGFSLGGLHAFDLVWHHSNRLGSVGVFSGALWWRSATFDEDQPDANRIVHDYVKAATKVTRNIRVWLMAGTEDEKEDRNNNGIIDAIDDTIGLQALLRAKGLKSDFRLSYHEEIDGRHEPATWGEVMPRFLDWWYQNKT